MDEPVLPEWAKKSLIGKTIEGVSDTAPHSLSLKFTDGDSLHMAAMPSKDGMLDASLVVVSDLLDD